MHNAQCTMHNEGRAKDNESGILILQIWNKSQRVGNNIDLSEVGALQRALNFVKIRTVI